MHAKVMQKDGKIYIAGTPGQPLIRDEQEAVDSSGYCGEHNTQRLLLYCDNLPADFF